MYFVINKQMLSIYRVLNVNKRHLCYKTKSQIHITVLCNL